MKAVANLEPPKYKSKLEADFALILEARKRSGKIHDWRYEPVSLKIGNKARYTPDFMVIGDNGEITFGREIGQSYK